MSTRILTSFLALAAMHFIHVFAQDQADPHFVIPHDILQTTRLDPIVTPGKVSGHVHTIVGASNFDKTVTDDLQQASSCTTAKISIDKSMYWAPSLYSYSAANSSFLAVPITSANTYYLKRSNKQPVAFPYGLRMLSGDPKRRSYNASSIDDQAVSVACLFDYQHELIPREDPRMAERPTFFNDFQCDINRLQVHFPNCGNGKLDSDDHKSHMAWLSNGIYGGDCPDSHPIPYPRLFYEFHFYTRYAPFTAGSENYVLSFGDTTGYGFHADFIAGWPADDGTGANVLEQALDPSICPRAAFDLGGCPPLAKHLNYEAAGACLGARDVVDEDIGQKFWLKQLPGNDPVWDGSGDKPTTSGYVESAGFRSVNSTIPTGWHPLGCFPEGENARLLSDFSLADQPNMTRASCVQTCAEKGFSLAGMEYGQECYCGNEFGNGVAQDQPAPWWNCSVPCTGLPTETCGGLSFVEVFKNTGDTSPAYGAPGVSAPIVPDVNNGTTSENATNATGTSLASHTQTPATGISGVSTVMKGSSGETTLPEAPQVTGTPTTGASGVSAMTSSSAIGSTVTNNNMAVVATLTATNSPSTCKRRLNRKRRTVMHDV